MACALWFGETDLNGRQEVEHLAPKVREVFGRVNKVNRLDGARAGLAQGLHYEVQTLGLPGRELAGGGRLDGGKFLNPRWVRCLRTAVPAAEAPLVSPGQEARGGTDAVCLHGRE